MSCYDKNYLFRTPILYNRHLSATEIVQAAIVKETAILDNSKTKPHYSAKVILWVGGLVFLAMATGAALFFIGGPR